jgi:Zn-dependent M28 family amino/carboxypeptidase
VTYSGSGNVTASVTPVDLILPPAPAPNTSTSGCEAADFAGFPVGNIALLQRGSCVLRQKAENAAAAGASGVIIFNEGQPGRTNSEGFTLSPPQFSIPVVFTSFAIGQQLANLAPSGLTVHMKVDATATEHTADNVLADRPGCDDSVVMVGAHLDSVDNGPGINDNGSGSATVLEIALQLAEQNIQPQRTVRFAWWAAEEFGLLGSEHYVANLSPEELARITAYLNFDMVGSPNFVRFVYDGDGSSGLALFPPGSGALEDVFRDYFADLGLPVAEIAITASDHNSFSLAGVPVGGLFSGAGGIKTAEEAAVYGGTAGVQYDPCYHQACDTFDNVNLTILDQFSDAAAHALLSLALDPTLCLDLRANISEKGSLLQYSKVDLRWNATGTLVQDTVLTLTNDYPGEVYVQMYFVNGDPELDPVFSSGPAPILIAEGEPGCNWVDCQLLLTPDQPIYWSAATGHPAGCQPFEILDPDAGSGPGRPDPEVNDGSRVLRGYVIAWAVNQSGEEISWNHLSGKATIVDYVSQSAWEYDAWSFQALAEDRRLSLPNPGVLELNGVEYDLAFDMLLYDFFAVGSQSLSGGGTIVTVDGDLTLHPVAVDLRQEHDEPVTTKAHFDIWNMNERKLSNTRRCITCWDQTLLSQYNAPNSFLLANLQSDKGKARIDGKRADECEENCLRDETGNPFPIEDLVELLGDLFNNIDVICSQDAPLLGVAAKILTFGGPAGQRDVAGSPLVGMGMQSATIQYDIIDPPGSLRDEAFQRIQGPSGQPRIDRIYGGSKQRRD